MKYILKEDEIMEDYNYNNNQNDQENPYEYNTSYNYTPTGNYGQPDHEVMTVGQWFLVIIAGIIPCVGLVLYLVWAFGNGGTQNRKNYCRAWLIYYVIQMVIAIIVGIVFSVSIMPTIMNSYY